ncbi:hypothetical protein JOB18_020763 [Solea senegalensis]|uniref:Uncharacterized protein n=1 Tax=Solea senegalensis TaxID=28829 RepID=A0AAV6RQN1_SOLSE|nr:hypothetical protein JOB18_020763 [Solea senegalensis]
MEYLISEKYDVSLTKVCVNRTRERYSDFLADYSVSEDKRSGVVEFWVQDETRTR